MNLDSMISSLSAQQLSAWQKCHSHTQGHRLPDALPPSPAVAAADAFVFVKPFQIEKWNS